MLRSHPQKRAHGTFSILTCHIGPIRFKNLFDWAAEIWRGLSEITQSMYGMMNECPWFARSHTSFKRISELQQPSGQIHKALGRHDMTHVTLPVGICPLSLSLEQWRF